MTRAMPSPGRYVRCSVAICLSGIRLEEHLWHCLRQLRDEIDEPTYLAFQHYVIEQWPIEKVCRELNMKANNVYTIKWRMTEKVTARMRELLGDLE